MIGEKLLCDRYVLEEKLGSGSLGDLYRATDTRTNRAVAVRLVTNVQDPLALASYYRQWAIQTGIRDQNVGEILDIAEVNEGGDRYPIVVTPLSDARPLSDLFVQPLSGTGREDWLLAVCKAALGVEAAHKSGLTHGHLHAGNILVSRDRDVRVVDFGAATAAGRDGVQKDIQALAAIAYEAVTGGIPPEDSSSGQAVLASSSCGEDVRLMLKQTLWSEGEPRFRSAGEFANALGSSLSGETPAQATEPNGAAEPDDSPPAAPIVEPPAQPEQPVAEGLRDLDSRITDQGAQPASPAADLEQRVAEEPDLAKAVQLLQEAVTDQPGSRRLSRLLEAYREKAETVREIAHQIQKLESEGKFDQAAEQLEILKAIHPGFVEGVAPVSAMPPAPPPPEESSIVEHETAFTHGEPAVEAYEPVAPPEQPQEEEPAAESANLEPAPAYEAESTWESPSASAEPTDNTEDDAPPEETTPLHPALTRTRPAEATPAETDTVELELESVQPEAPQKVERPVKLAESLDKATAALRPKVASLSATVKTQLQQLSGAPEEAADTEALIQESDEAEEPKEETPTKERSRKWIYAAAGGLLAVFAIGVFLMLGGSGGETAALRTAVIRAYPPEAEILIDGEPCGIGECTAELEMGGHRATARLAGFEPEFNMFEAEEPASGASAKSAPPQRVELYLTAIYPSVDVETDLATGTVYLDDVEIGEIEDGSFTLRELADGEHSLRVRSGAVQTTLTLVAEAGKAPILSDLASREAKVLVASSLGASATFWASTADAAISIDGEERGTVGDDGLRIDDLAEGPHNGSTDNGDTTTAFRVDNSPRLAMALNTDRNVGGLRITAGQDGATVYINDRPYRRKTARGGLLVFLYPGQYRVRVEKAGFIASPEYTVEIRKGARETIDSPLEAEPSLGTLRIGGAPAGAAVRIDNELVGEVASNGTFSYEAVPPGNRVIQISRDGYQTRTLREAFEAGGSTQVDGSLERADGELVVSVAPENAQALLVVRDAQGAIVQLQNRRASLPVGTYTITASANGFRSATAEVRVRGGQENVAEIRLESTAPARPTGPQDLTALLAEDPAWRRSGDNLVRRGGEFITIPSQGAGTYRFSVNLERGRRLQWVVNYRDEDNFGWFQLGRDNFIRALMSGGNRSRPVAVEHSLGDFRSATIEIRVSENEIVHRLRRDGEWVELDRWRFTGANFSEGRFGFRLPDRDELTLRSLTFTAAP